MKARSTAVGLAVLLLSVPAAAQIAPGLAGRMAQAENAGTVTSNPAGTTRLEGFHLVFDTIVAVSDNKFEVKDGTTVDGGNPKNTVEYAGLPLFSFSIPFDDLFPYGDRLRFNFGLSVPAGFGSDWGNSWAGRYLSTDSDLFFVSATPSLSFRVTDWLSVSAGLPITYSKSENKVAVRNLEPGAADGRAKLEVDGTSVGAQLAFLLEPIPGTRLGLSWRSESEPEMDGTPKFRDLGPVLEGLLDAAGLLDEKVELDMRVPQVVQFGFYQELFQDWSVGGDVAWIDWSRFGKIDIKIAGNSITFNTNYDDIWVGSVGTEYRLSDRTKVGIGFSYVSSAIRNKHRTLALPMDEMFLIGIGGYHQLLPDFGVQANFMVLQGGDGEVDDESPAGRVVGEFERRRSYVFQVALVWGKPPPRAGSLALGR